MEFSFFSWQRLSRKGVAALAWRVLFHIRVILVRPFCALYIEPLSHPPSSSIISSSSSRSYSQHVKQRSPPPLSKPSASSPILLSSRSKLVNVKLISTTFEHSAHPFFSLSRSTEVCLLGSYSFCTRWFFAKFLRQTYIPRTYSFSSIPCS